MGHERFTVSRTRRFSPRAAALILAATAGLNAGCEIPTLPEIPGVYRIDIQQGNIVDRKMLDQLEIGMEPRKVRFILGTPLLVDPFNQSRWDYVYSLRRGSGEETRQRVSVYFVNDRLARIEDHLDPAAVSELAAERIQTRVKVPKHSPPRGFLDRLIPDFLTQDDEPTSEAEVSGAQPVARQERRDPDATPPD